MSSKRLSAVEFLRGSAAFIVFIYHFSGPGLPKISIEPIRRLFSWGWLGVEMFFVISGFIIPYVLMKNHYRLADFRSFIGKRFVRICPPSYVILAFTIIQYYAIDKLKLSGHPWFGALSVPQIVHNITYTVPFTDYNWINGIFWTLAIEFQFYIFIGLVFPFMYRNVTQFILWSLFTCSLFYLPLAQQARFFQYGTLFIMGGLALFFFEKRINLMQYVLLLIATAVVCYMQLGILEALFGVGTALGVSFLRVENKVTLFLGKISYSLYLSHILIGSSIEAILMRLLPSGQPLERAVLLFISIIAGLIGAYLFHHFIETYFIKLSNRLFAGKEKKFKVVKSASL